MHKESIFMSHNIQQNNSAAKLIKKTNETNLNSKFYIE